MARPKKTEAVTTDDMSVVTEELLESDEIEVISLIPNVSYYDKNTGDLYEWNDIGQVEYLTFAEIKNMWKNYKGYFRNLWIKPNDDRVIKKFGLEKIYEKYEFIMNPDNYTKKNINILCQEIESAPNSLKYTIINKTKILITEGVISDANVIRALEKQLNADLFELLG